MSTLRTFSMIIGLGFTLFVAFWSLAQSQDRSATKDGSAAHAEAENLAREIERVRHNDVAVDKFLLLYKHLTETGQTNTLELLTDYTSANLVQGSSREITVKLRVLRDLHAGLTNEAIHLIEKELTSDVLVTAIGYRRIGASLRQKLDLAALREARSYFIVYEVKFEKAETQEAVLGAFRLPDEKITK